MTNKELSENVFSLPLTKSKAGQVFYAVMCSGIVFVPMLLLVYNRFIEPQVKTSTREFFPIFSAIYLLLFLFSTVRASNASISLRGKLKISLPRDVTVVAPVAANSDVPEIVELGRQYWFWQLVCSYFAGVTFSWFGCLLYLFVI